MPLAFRLLIPGHGTIEVPVVSQIADNLWMGGVIDGHPLPEGIRHVISVHPWESWDIPETVDSYVMVKMADAAALPNYRVVDTLAQWVNVCRLHGPTLVHCQAGLNRSGLITAYALILEGMTPAAAIELLRDKRHPMVLFNSTFDGWLRRGNRAKIPDQYAPPLPAGGVAEALSDAVEAEHAP